mmetsp:Transcript_63762/g.178430  ORF Transcript_63762/g.178430 Transcript_63762/m.178430 type:complete len:260 (+) Transcript_63762:1616-2395(+)
MRYDDSGWVMSWNTVLAAGSMSELPGEQRSCARPSWVRTRPGATSGASSRPSNRSTCAAVGRGEIFCTSPRNAASRSLEMRPSPPSSSKCPVLATEAYTASVCKASMSCNMRWKSGSRMIRSPRLSVRELFRKRANARAPSWLSMFKSRHRAFTESAERPAPRFPSTKENIHLTQRLSHNRSAAGPNRYGSSMPTRAGLAMARALASSRGANQPSRLPTSAARVLDETDIVATQKGQLSARARRSGGGVAAEGSTLACA